MRLLLDTHILLWMSDRLELLSLEAMELLGNAAHELCYSPVNIWEIAVKSATGRDDFLVDPREFRDELDRRRFRELPIRSDHAIAVAALPNHHKDPFDRMLLAQAIVEGITLVTADRHLARYPGPIHKV